MLFNSVEFIFVFLPITLILYHLARKQHFNLAMAVLTLASLFYYAWWNPPYLLVIVASMAVNYAASHAMAKWDRLRKPLFILGVAANLGALMFFKYTNFLVDQFNLLRDDPWQISHIILPLGISFFTFQQIAYLADVYLKKVQPGDLLSFTTFVTFFPQLIAGPIVHHSQMMPQFNKDRQWDFNWDDLSVGLTMFSMGLFKKVILADSLSPYVQAVFDQVHQGKPILPIDAALGVLAYTFQIYFDFSGYSDMAIGAARMFGIILPLNFYSPYKATSIIDFWRRWHITLSIFLRDYLYIPLGGNRHGAFNRYRNLILTMFLGGLWHGAGWGFVVWGALHGTLLVINHGWRFVLKHYHVTVIQQHGWYRMIGRCLTFVVVVICWTFFRANTATDAMHMLLNMLNFNPLDLPAHLAEQVSWARVVPDTLSALSAHGKVLTIWLPLAVFITFVMPNTEQFMSTQHQSYHNLPKEKQGWLVFHYDWVCAAMTIFCLLFSVYNMLILSKSEFLYYDF